MNDSHFHLGFEARSPGAALALAVKHLKPLAVFMLRFAMRLHLLAFLVWFCFAAVSPRTWAWGREGHEKIADLAQTMLSNNVLTKVQSILGPTSLSSVALWADQTRQLMKDANNPGPLKGNAEAEKFIADHPDNDKWHFVNLPLKVSKYTYNGRFATSNDIVHTLTNCIAVLEGKSHFMTTTQALRYIIHLVGDLHQPLHVGCGYYADNGNGTAKLLKTSSTIFNIKAHDAGGNLLLWLSGHFTNKMHAYWDDHMVSQVDTNQGHPLMTSILTNTIAAHVKTWTSKDDLHRWPALWAKQSANEANGAYDGVILRTATFRTDSTLRDIWIDPLDTNHDNNQRDRVTRQLARAAFHLAELLNSIQWQ
jgi:hypothetical protein